MKSLLLTSAASVVLALSLAGCGHQDSVRQEPPDTSAEQARDIGVSYSAVNGLLLSPETAKFIGLETVEVSERPINATLEVTARIFRAANAKEPRALASAPVSSADAALLRPGITSLSAPSSSAAEVLRIEGRGEPRNGMMEAILQVRDAALALSEGGFVTVRFPAGSTNSVIAVPNAAVLHTTAGDFVFVENGAHFARAAVKLGRADGEFTEVSEGLLAGDRVVVRPVMTLWMTELHNINGGDACCIRRETRR